MHRASSSSASIQSSVLQRGDDGSLKLAGKKRVRSSEVDQSATLNGGGVIPNTPKKPHWLMPSSSNALQEEVRRIQLKQCGLVRVDIADDASDMERWAAHISNRDLCMPACSAGLLCHPKEDVVPTPYFLGREYMLSLKNMSEETLAMVHSALTVNLPRYDITQGKILENQNETFEAFRHVQMRSTTRTEIDLLAVPRAWGHTHFGPAPNIPNSWTDPKNQWEPPSFPHDYAPDRAKMQKGAVDAYMKARSKRGYGGGVLVLQCGAGKTYVAFRLAKELKSRMVFFVTSKFLMTQAMDAAHKWMPGAHVTQVGDGVVDWSGDICICMVQMLQHHKPPPEAVAKFTLLVGDEIHHGASRSYIEAIKLFAPRDIVGLTGTIVRNTKDEFLMFWHIGPVLYSWFPDKPIVPATVLFVKGGFFTEQAPEGRSYGGSDKTIDWVELRKMHSRDKRRDIAMADLTLRYILTQETDGTLFFCKAVAHTKRMAEVIRRGVDELYMMDAIQEPIVVEAHHGKLSKKARAKAVASGRILVATIDTLGEGADFQGKSMLTIDNMAKTVRQVAARVVRPGREHALIIDHVDVNQLSANMSRARRKEYVNSNYEVEDWDYRRNQAVTVGPYTLVELPIQVLTVMEEEYDKQMEIELKQEAEDKKKAKAKAAEKRKKQAEKKRAMALVPSNRDVMSIVDLSEANDDESSDEDVDREMDVNEVL